MHELKFRHQQQGLTLIELAIIIALLGTYIMVIMHYRANRIDSSDTVAVGIQDQVVAAVYRFAERHYRLPCADTNGDGFEGAGSGCGNAQEHQVGGVPYRTLGMSESDVLTSGKSSDYVYGIYRNETENADLAVLEERTSDAPADAGFRDLDDLRFALSQLTSTTVDPSQIYVTGDDDLTGPADCNNKIANIAFFVVYAGKGDANGDGNKFDGANSLLSGPSSNHRCVAGQTTRHSEQYDDSVVAISFAELLGYLTR